MRENIKLLKIKYKDKETNAVLTDNALKYPENYRTKHRIKPKGLIHRYEDKIQENNPNALRLQQAPQKPPLLESKTNNQCYRSKTMGPIARPISNNFALINSNLNEIENLLKSPKPQTEVNLDLKKGLHDWSLWRAKFNETLIKSCFTPAKLKKSIQTHNDLRVKSHSYIEPSFVHYSSHYGDDTNLDPENFMFFGIPRARLNSRATLAEEESDQITIEEKIPDTSNSFINHTDSVKLKVSRSNSQVVTGVSVKEKIKAFETEKKVSVRSGEEFIETKHFYRHEPETKLVMMSMPTQEVLKAVDGDIIFHRPEKKIEEVKSPEKVNCLGKTKSNDDPKKPTKNYFLNILRSKSKSKSDAPVEKKDATLKRRKRDVKSSVKRKPRECKTEKIRSKTCKKHHRSMRQRPRKSRNYQILHPGNYQTYPTRKSPFFITNNTAQNIEYFTNHILESSVDIEKLDRDIIDLSSSSSSSILTMESLMGKKSKTFRERTRRHFDRVQRQKSQHHENLVDNFPKFHKSKVVKMKQSVSSRDSLPPPPPPPSHPPEIQNMARRRSSDMSKMSVPPPPQNPPPSLNRYRESLDARSGLRRMKVTEEKYEFERAEIIRQDGEKELIEKEKYPNLFKLPRLKQTMDTSSILSTTTFSNTKTKPKTSKEILQEISRLTNGTTFHSRLNSTFQNNCSSDLDLSVMSTATSRVIHYKK